MITGRRCRVTFNGRTVDAQATGSDNLRSLVLVFDAAVYTSDGGMYPGGMPVLLDGDGVYRDLIRNERVELKWTE